MDVPRRRGALTLFYYSFSVVGIVLWWYFFGDVLQPPTLGVVVIGLLFSIWYIVRPVVSGLIAVSDGRTEQETYASGEWPSVSVQMPAYNEEENIRESIESVVTQSYSGPLEIIAVDDGSEDATWEILQSLAKEYDILSVFTKNNEGLSQTRNYALARGSNEIVVTMDSDSYMIPDSLRSLVSPFVESDVVGVASNVEVYNAESSWWTRAQSIEYLVSMEMARQFQARFRSLMVISGGCGAYRRSVIESVDGWNPRSNWVAEDFDLTLRVSKYGRTMFVPSALALTECPDTLRGWWHQRFLWAGRGLRTVFIRRSILFNSLLHGFEISSDVSNSGHYCR